MRKLFLAALVAAGFAFLILGAFRAGGAPAITIEPSSKAIGRRTSINVEVSEPGRGLSRVVVELVQGDRVEKLSDTSYTPRPSWAFWGTRTAEDTIRVEVGADAVTGLKQTDATVRVLAARAGSWLRSPDPARAEMTIPVRLTPPSLHVLSNFHYVNQGGCEVVAYRVGETAVKHGVRAGSWFFPGAPLPGGGPRDRFALFAVPYDMPGVSDVQLVAEDDIGNVARLAFIDRFFPKPLRRDTIRLADAFMTKVVPEIVAQTPEIEDKGSLLDNYLQINRDLRKHDRAVQVELATASKSEFLWSRPFQPMKNTAVMASFADRRDYLYRGAKVDQQDHLGLDMASVRGDAVPAANDGVVVLARYFGIYGNAIVIDHGYGLQSLYGRLSSIDVAEGETVARGQIIGRSGATGLAGGDHLHFEIVLHGLAVSPIEWWDPKWIQDRLKRKLGAALPYPG